MTFKWVMWDQHPLRFLALVQSGSYRAIICYDNDNHLQNKCSYELEKTGLVTCSYVRHGNRYPHAIKTGVDYV